MRVIGIGGMSWESTAEYYRLTNRLVTERLGGLHSARLLVASVDFAEIEELQRAGEWDRAGVVLAGVARSLQAGGAELLLLATNTMHIVADAVAAAADIPLLHIGDVTAAAVQAAGVVRVGLLGTAFTMEQPFLRDRLASHGLDVAVPGPDDRALVHRVIYAELCLGIVRDDCRCFAAVPRSPGFLGLACKPPLTVTTPRHSRRRRTVDRCCPSARSSSLPH